tara:strand:- start:397 stop:762 length:366 start_codon:yes stop_codon:yes gene_type:complete
MKNKIHSKLLLMALVSLAAIFFQSCSDDNTNNSQTTETVKVDPNEWTLGTWSTAAYDDVEFKLSVLPGNKGKLYMLEQWLECTYNITGNTLIATRNGVDIIFNLDKNENKIYMAGGNVLSK